MKTVKVSKLPKCDFCEQRAEFDAPTKMGPWAHMCTAHFEEHGASKNMASKLQMAPKQQEEKFRVVKGIEDTSEDVLESIIFDSANREIECPECGEIRAVEPDAHYVYLCECGVKVQVPTPFC